MNGRDPPFPSHPERIRSILRRAGEEFFALLDRHYWAVSVLCCAITISLLLFTTPFVRPLREDAFLYLTKAAEILNGDWTPRRSHFIGWSILEAVCFKLFGVQDTMWAMTVARLLSIAVVGACVLAFAYVARRTTEPKASVLALLAFSLAPLLNTVGRIAYADALFSFLVLSMACVMLCGWRLQTRLLVAAIVASLAYFVRPNGIFLLILLLVWAFPAIRSGRLTLGSVGLAILVFFVVSAPHLYGRYDAYGSPFDYGESSKYFVDDYDTEVWNADVPAPSFWDYLSTRSVSDYVEKFVVGGVGKLLYRLYTHLGPLWFLLLGIGLADHLLMVRDNPRRLHVAVLFVVIPLAGLVPVFDVFNSERFIAPIIPFALLIATSTLLCLFQYTRMAAFYTCLALLLVSWNALTHLGPRLTMLSFHRPRVQDQWAIWAAEHVRGRIAIVEGADLIRISQLAAEEAELETLAEPNEEWESFRPANYADLEEAYSAFRKMGVQYVFVDNVHSWRRRYLRQIYRPEWSEKFSLLRSFEGGPEDGWFVKDMDIFAVR